MGGVGSGRLKTPSTMMREAKEKDLRNLPIYFDKLSQMALGSNVKCPHCGEDVIHATLGDREALVYLVDRHLGKTKAVIDIEGGEDLGVGLVTKILDLVAEKRKELPIIEGKLLEEGKDV